MKSASAPFGLVVLCVAVCAVAVTPSVAAQEQVETKRASTVSLDFNNLELPVFVKFISELTGKNFVIDEKVKGKVTVFSPCRSRPIGRTRFFLPSWRARG